MNFKKNKTFNLHQSAFPLTVHWVEYKLRIIKISNIKYKFHPHCFLTSDSHPDPVTFDISQSVHPLPVSSCYIEGHFTQLGLKYYMHVILTSTIN